MKRMLSLLTVLLLLAALCLPAAAAFILCSGWRKACRKQTATAWEAAGYLVGSMNISHRSDCYVRTIQARTKIERSTESSSDGSGGTTVDCDGFSGTSGKF